MKVSFAPSNYHPVGTIAFVSWENLDLQDAMRRLFRESPREKIVELVVDQAGIKAIFGGEIPEASDG